MSIEPAETSPVPHAEAKGSEPQGARRRAMTWGAGALTFSVLTLGGFALNAPVAAPGTGGAGPAADTAAATTEAGTTTPAS
jgi:hypothetical protein